MRNWLASVPLRRIPPVCHASFVECAKYELNRCRTMTT
jgi:hypothetical protein